MKKYNILDTLMVLILVLVLAVALTGCGNVAAGDILSDPTVTVGGLTPGQIVADLIAAALKLLLLVVLWLAARILLPFLKNTVIPFLEEKHLMGIVRILTRSAEKQGETGAIDKSQKRDFVIKWLKKKNIQITPFVENMIEAAVEELDKMGDQVLNLLDDDTVGEVLADISLGGGAVPPCSTGTTPPEVEHSLR